VEQWVRFGGRWCGGEHVRARRSEGGNGGLVSPPGGRARREEGIGAAVVYRGDLRSHTT
jgi:hypothetical protein